MSFTVLRSMSQFAADSGADHRTNAPNRIHLDLFAVESCFRKDSITCQQVTQIAELLAFPGPVLLSNR